MHNWNSVPHGSLHHESDSWLQHQETQGQIAKNRWNWRWGSYYAAKCIQQPNGFEFTAYCCLLQTNALTFCRDGITVGVPNSLFSVLVYTCLSQLPISGAQFVYTQAETCRYMLQHNKVPYPLSWSLGNCSLFFISSVTSLYLLFFESTQGTAGNKINPFLPDLTKWQNCKEKMLTLIIFMLEINYTGWAYSFKLWCMIIFPS